MGSEDVGELRAWISEELVRLWNDLRREERLNLSPRGSGKWSVAMDSVGERIQTATALVGPVDWRCIAWPRVASGWFAEMNTRLGITPCLPTDEEKIQTEARYQQLVGNTP